MSIDIKTLRIGAHISIGGKRERVRGMDEDNGLIIRFPAEYVMANDVEPIRITPELLTELGFECRREACWLHWWRDGFDLQHRDESEYYHFRGDMGLKYLHELESLYYLIYEQELIPD